MALFEATKNCPKMLSDLKIALETLPASSVEDAAEVHELRSQAEDKLEWLHAWYVLFLEVPHAQYWKITQITHD